MGFKNFLLKKGLGSPGQTARIWAEQYNLCLSNHLSEEEALESVILNFQMGQSKVRNLLHQSKAESVITYAENDLAVVLFSLLCDTKGFSKNVRQLFHETTEVLYNEIDKIAPDSLKYDLDGFKQKASNILMYLPS